MDNSAILDLSHIIKKHHQYAIRTDSGKKTFKWVTVNLKVLVDLGDRGKRIETDMEKKGNLKIITSGP